MMFIDPHIHMSARTTDDYEAMAAAGVVAVIEPAFWLGQPRTRVDTYIDYLSSLVGWERFRASQFGIRHYCTVGLNSKEANNEELAEAVMEILPRFATKEGVVAIGEIGYDEQTALEDKYYRAQLELAKELDLPVMIHTPHRDNQGDRRSMDVCIEHGLDPSIYTTITKKPSKKFWTADSGLLSPSIQRQKWARNAWWMWCADLEASAYLSIQAPIGVSAILWPCQKRPV